MNRDNEFRKYKLQKLLKDNIVEVVFTKVNGEQRRMKCTLKPELLPQSENWDVVIESIPKHLIPENVLPVWDIEKNGWRSFRIESVLDFVAMRSENANHKF